jgi:hypothetical protein
MTARQYGKLLTSIWRDEDWRQLTADAQWLYEHLLSQPSLSTAGVLPIQLTKWAKGAADMTVERVKAAAKVLVDRRYIVVDHDTEEALVRSFIRHDASAVGTPKVLTGALNCALQVQSRQLRAVLLTEIRRLDREMTSDQLQRIDALEASLSASKQQQPQPLQQQLQPSHPNGYRKASERLSSQNGPTEDAILREMP